MAEMPVFSAVVRRLMGERQVTGHYAGYPILDTVTVQREMVLTALTQEKLDLMVRMVAVDGWKV